MNPRLLTDRVSHIPARVTGELVEVNRKVVAMSTAHTSTDRIERTELVNGGSGWWVGDHAAARAVLADLRFSSAAAADPDFSRGRDVPLNPDSILGMDPPRHTRMRRPSLKLFSAAHAERLRGLLERTAEELLDGLDGPPVDLLEAFIAPFTSAGITAALGLPPVDHAKVRNWIRPVLAVTAEQAVGAGEGARRYAAYLHELLQDPDVWRDDNVVPGLVAAHDHPNDAVRMIAFTLISGHVSTSVQLSNGVLALLDHPDQWQRLVAEPDLADRAVEELLRFTPPETYSLHPRKAVEDVELAGVPIRAGDLVFVCPQHANRDPAVFPDPDRLDITREKCPHLTFGPGRHHCVGAHLARLELRIALAALARRFPGLRLAVPRAEVRHREGLQFRELFSLPVRW